MSVNVLLLMTDQHRFDCLGCYGSSVVETPNLDELAQMGTRFSHCYTPVPSCIPARACLLTGMDQWHTGILGMGEGQGEISTNYEHTLPGELAAAGYHTQAVGKNHFYPQRALNGYHNCIIDESGRTPDGVVQSDYRDWFEAHKNGEYSYRDHACEWNSWVARPSHLPEWLHPTHWTAQTAIDFLHRRDPEKPFFMKVSFARPHSPYDPPQVYYDLYRDKKIPKPDIGGWAQQNIRSEERDAIDAWRTNRPPEEIERARRCYYANITFIDHQIGRLIYEMKYTYKNFDDTLIIFTSDHGDMLGDQNLWRKTYAYEGSAHIPLIIKPPKSWGFPEGQVVNDVVGLQDIMPTVLDLLGLAVPDVCDGKSLKPQLQGKRNETWRSYYLGEHCDCYGKEQENYFVTDGMKKFVWMDRTGQEQFFDLVNDPMEHFDRRYDPKYRKEMLEWRACLIKALSERNCGLVENGDLKIRTEKHNIVSPNYGIYGCKSKGGVYD